jgi:molybdopterin-guanine dinucleotide biosynthesis protein B
VTGAKAMRIFGLAGWSGSGKTTLVTRLLPELTRRGVTVSTLKHAHHSFDLDQPGKDSWRHREAGASEVMIASSRRWALIHEHRGAAEPPLEALIRQMTPVDLLLVEGFKRGSHAKLEVHRPSLGQPLLCRDDPHIVALASDAPVPGVGVPVFALDDVAGIAGFILDHCRLKAA